MELNKSKVLEVKGLKLNYGDSLILDTISMDVYENQIVALVGASGAGKSSFLSCLNQLCYSVPCCEVSGEIRFLGQKISSSRASLIELRRNIGMIFQKPNPFPISIKKI